MLDAEPRYVDLSYRDQDTPVVTYDEDWQNNRQKATVSVLKKEKDTDRVLEGAIFGLYAKEDILSEYGKVLIEADTIIELKPPMQMEEYLLSQTCQSAIPIT